MKAFKNATALRLGNGVPEPGEAGATEKRHSADMSEDAPHFEKKPSNI